MESDKIEHEIFLFAANAHFGQERKYTFEPYINHCVSVANKVKENGGTPSMVYAALLHDVVEDTKITPDEIKAFLLSIGLIPFVANNIVQMVEDLTDKYTSEAYPDLNRRKRKTLECQRLASIQPKSQTIKYCDLIDNSRSILENDPEFAKTYLSEKSDILAVMNKGDADLYAEACRLIELKQFNQS